MPSNLVVERMKSVILDRFAEVQVEINGQMETLTTNEEYEQARVDINELFDNLSLGLTRIDECTTKKKFKELTVVFQEVLTDLYSAIDAYFEEYLDSVYQANKDDLK